MQLVKCPRCDLNYIREDEKYCKVCLRELKGEKNSEEVELCSICNEEPALPGRDVCLFCLKEMNANDREEDESEDRVDEASLSIDPVSSMDEIIPEVEEEETDEFEEIDQEMSLEDVREDEERDAEDDEEEEEI